MEIISAAEPQKWNHIIKSFPYWDIYYLCEYATAFSIHGDGEPCLIYYSQDTLRLCYIVLKNDIACCKSYDNLLEKGQWFDYAVPYGYGGPLTEGLPTVNAVECFFGQLNAHSKENNIVSQFIRFHPLYQNQAHWTDYCDLKLERQTIHIDTTSDELIWNNIDSKNRNMIRKAIKNEVSIIYDSGERFEDFIRIYEATMQQTHAENYYFFSTDYFEHLLQHMKDNLIIFYALYKGEIITASMFFFNENYMHYHLSGTLKAYRPLASTNLLLYKAALFAAEKGIQKLHLGGGIFNKDSLFSFKKSFNKNGTLDFYIGRNIFNPEIFDYLVKLRQENDSSFDNNTPRLIKYRA